MYDQYDFITNYDRVKGEPVDQGDSTFFMGLQALMYCCAADNVCNLKPATIGEFYLRAYSLWVRCANIDWDRHPTLDDTSFDMMVIWDYVVTRYPNVALGGHTWVRPPFHKRPSKYWSGRNRAEWMFEPWAVVALLGAYLVRPPVGHDYYKTHLAMLQAGTCYNLTKDKLVRWFMAKLTHRVEKITGAANPFFRWLARIPQQEERPLNWGTGVVEWMFQRDIRLKGKYKKLYQNIEFHAEKLPDGTVLRMSDQFLQIIFYPGAMQWNA